MTLQMYLPSDDHPFWIRTQISQSLSASVMCGKELAIPQQNARISGFKVSIM